MRAAAFCLALLATTVVAAHARAHDEPCVVTNAGDPCGPGEVCSEPGGELGACVPLPCATPDECRNAGVRTQCDLAAVPSECVECLTDAHCPSGRVCERDSRTGRRGLCAECLLGRGEMCASRDEGMRCLIISGTCGCAGPSDCPPGRQCTGAATGAGTCTLPDSGAPAPDADDAGSGRAPEPNREPSPRAEKAHGARSGGCASASASASANAAGALTAAAVVGALLGRRWRRARAPHARARVNAS